MARVSVPATVALVLSLAGASSQLPKTSATADERWRRARSRMVEDQLRGRDIRSEKVLEAMRRVPRHLFVPVAMRDDAYSDSALPIGLGQTISQPYIVAFMTEALDVQPEHRVLEIGTGSGYQAAVLAESARDVYSMEIVEALANTARATLTDLGYRNVHTRTGNGYAGWPERAPFDRIIVTAAPPEVPRRLIEQLKPAGLIAVPVGRDAQELRILGRTAQGLSLSGPCPSGSCR